MKKLISLLALLAATSDSSGAEETTTERSLKLGMMYEESSKAGLFTEVSANDNSVSLTLTKPLKQFGDPDKLPRQTDLDLFYKLNLNEKEAIKLGSAVKFNTVNDNKYVTETTVIAKYSLKF